MKKLTIRIALALALCAAASGSIAASSAKVKTRTLTFGTDFWAGSTLVKKGTYKIAFDDQTNEISILDKATAAVVARVPAQVKKREGNKRSWDVALVTVGDRMTLVRLAFPEASQSLVLNEAGAALAEKAQAEKTATEKPQ